MADVVNFDKASLAWTLPWDADWVTAVRFLGPTRKLAAGNNLGQILLWELPVKPGGPPPAFRAPPAPRAGRPPRGPQPPPPQTAPRPPGPQGAPRRRGQGRHPAGG